MREPFFTEKGCVQVKLIINKRFLSAAMFFLGVAVTVSALALMAAAARGKPVVSADVPSHPKPVFEVNKNGETYGSIKDVAVGDYPDLIAAVGVGGKEGYVRYREMHPEEEYIKTPENAIAWQEKYYAEGGYHYVPLYDKEGAVIGEFLVGNDPDVKYD